MKREGSGTEARGIKGLFKMSKQGQDRVLDFLFPKSTAPKWRRAVLDAITTAADRSDRWLANRAPAT
jgi:hypothetical protein